MQTNRQAIVLRRLFGTDRSSGQQRLERTRLALREDRCKSAVILVALNGPCDSCRLGSGHIAVLGGWL